MRQQDAQHVTLRFSLDDFDDDAEALENELEGEEDASCGLSAIIREDGCLVIAEPVMLTPFGPLGPRLNLGDVIEVEPRSENEYRYVRIVERGNPVTFVLEPIDESVALSQSTLNVLDKFFELEGVWEYGSHRLTVQVPSESDELEELRLELVAVINEQRQSQPDSEASPGDDLRLRQPLQTGGLRDTQMPNMESATSLTPDALGAGSAPIKRGFVDTVKESYFYPILIIFGVIAAIPLIIIAAQLISVIAVGVLSIIVVPLLAYIAIKEFLFPEPRRETYWPPSRLSAQTGVADELTRDRWHEEDRLLRERLLRRENAPKFSRSLESIGLSSRGLNHLHKQPRPITTVEQVLNMSDRDFLAWAGFGEGMLHELRSRVAD